MGTFNYNVIFWIFVSYAIGAMLTDFLVKKLKVRWFENKNYISDQWTKRLGILFFGWMIKNSFMGMFSRHLTIKKSGGAEELQTLKTNMGYSEVGHLIAFYFLLLVNITFVFMGLEWWYILLFFLINIVFNLYLVFLQQYNKRRIDRIIKRYT